MKSTRRYSYASKEPCRHCMERQASRAHGLCFVCGNDPAIRVQYARDDGFGRRGVGGGIKEGPRPEPAPCGFSPGSPEKVAVMEERARLGQNLWHPEDGRANVA